MDFLITENELLELTRKDNALGNFIEKYGNLSFTNNESLYLDINRNIIGQMLSQKAANTIFSRFIKTIENCSPENILKTSDEELRNCGISFAKIKYLKEIALNVKNKSLILDNLEEKDENEIIKLLSTQRGIGKWTAEMIALFSLGKRNIFSYDDVALRKGIKYVHPELDPDDKKEFLKLKQMYYPYCSIASLYYYHIHDNE